MLEPWTDGPNDRESLQGSDHLRRFLCPLSCSSRDPTRPASVSSWLEIRNLPRYSALYAHYIRWTVTARFDNPEQYGLSRVSHVRMCILALLALTDIYDSVKNPQFEQSYTG